MTPLLALLLAATPPAAAPARSDDSDPGDLQRWYAHGRCLVAAVPREADRFLAVRPGSMAMLTAFTQSDGKARCFDEAAGVKPRLHHNATRGAVVEALLLRDFSAVGVARTQHHAAVFGEGAQEVAEREAGEPRGMAYLALAQCAVRLAPDRVFSLFSTLPGTAAERDAIRPLVPALSDCIRPGDQVPLLAPVLRSYLAEAAYRVSVERLEGARP